MSANLNSQGPFIPFLWPDRVIGKRESRAIREQHNALFNSHAELLAAVKSLLPLAVHTSPQDVAVNAARLAIAKATGGAS